MLFLDASEGAVVGVIGPWGSGKTSFVNLARSHLKDADVPILDFNPWMFSGTEQLVESFFIELSTQLKLRPGFDQIGKELEDYGETFSGMSWLPVVGPWIERGRVATSILGKILQRRKEGIGGRRARVESALRRLDKPILAVVDDIDRLTTPEIREVFKLIRLTANFPNMIYIVAFDRQRVEDALTEQGIPGRDYLEKILQLAIDLPAVPTHVLNAQVFRGIDGALEKINAGPFDQALWPDVYIEIIRPLIRNMRDVRRYVAGLYGTVRHLGAQVALVDVLALEAVRIFLPDVFVQLHGCVDGLTSPSARSYGTDDPRHLKEQVERLIAAAGDRGAIVRALVQRLFPAAQRHIGNTHYGPEWKAKWLRDRRIAHEDILRLYLEKVVGESLLAFADAEQAWARMADRSAFETHLRSLNVDRLEDVISSLETYEDQFAPEHVVPGSIVLLNVLPELPERQRGMFSADTRFVVTRVVYRLVRSLKDPAAIEAAVRAISPEITTLSAKLDLITIVGYRQGAGHKLVSETSACQFEEVWRDEVRSASPETLATEKDLFRIFLTVKRDSSASEPPFVLPDSPAVTLGILKTAAGEVRSQTMGSRAVRRSITFPWDLLIDLFGDENTLKDRVHKLKQTHPEGADDLLELADKYMAGWRPDQRDEDD